MREAAQPQIETRQRHCPVPTRRGLKRVEAAEYIGVSATKFDEMVGDARMPKPRKIDGRRIWDVRALDHAFDDLPSDDALKVNEWDN